MLMLLLDESRSTVTLSWFCALAPPWLVFVVWIVFLMLEPEPLSLLNEGSLLCFREKSEEERDELWKLNIAKNPFKKQQEYIY